jgi:hypothetical protein
METHSTADFGHARELATIDHAIHGLASDTEQAGNLFGTKQVGKHRRVGGGPTWHCRGAILHCPRAQYKLDRGRAWIPTPGLGTLGQ